MSKKAVPFIPKAEIMLNSKHSYDDNQKQNITLCFHKYNDFSQGLSIDIARSLNVV